MRQAFRAGAALVAVALLAAGCAKPSSSSNGTGAGTAPKFLACMVADSGTIKDKSFNEGSWTGMQEAAAANSNVTIKFLPSSTTSDYAKNISTFEAQKCGIIVTVGFAMGPATQTAALASPKQKFAIVDCSYASFCLPSKPKMAHNINQLVYNTVEDAFLGGYLAAGMTKTGKVATFGGQKFGTVTIYMDGFWDGVQYYNKQHHTHVQVLGWSYPSQNGTFAGNFTNTAAGETITNTFITHGADIIFPVAGLVGLGAAKAVQTANQAGKHIGMFWVDTDGCVSSPVYCPYFVTSVEKGLSASVKAAVLNAAAGHTGGTYVGTLANGGAVLGPYHQWASKVPASLQSEIKALAQQIMSGQIKPATKAPV